MMGSSTIPAMLGNFLHYNANADHFVISLGLSAYRKPVIARPDGGGSDVINVGRWQQALTYEGGPRVITFCAAWNERTPDEVAHPMLRDVARALGAYHLGPTVGGGPLTPAQFPLYPALIAQMTAGPDADLRASGRAGCLRLVPVTDFLAFDEWVEPYFS